MQYEYYGHTLSLNNLKYFIEPKNLSVNVKSLM